jgi:hypothetical protein
MREPVKVRFIRGRESKTLWRDVQGFALGLRLERSDNISHLTSPYLSASASIAECVRFGDRWYEMQTGRNGDKYVNVALGDTDPEFC